MNRADDASSDVAVGAQPDSRRMRRDSDVMYRRPPAQPEAAAGLGGSWFGGPSPSDNTTADQPPAGPRRVSYGFSPGPISPNRQAAAPMPAAPAGAAESRTTAEQSPVRADPRPVTTGEFAALRPGNRDDYASSAPAGRGTGEFAALRPRATDQAEQHRDLLVQEPPRRSRLFTVGVVLLSAVVVLAGSLVGVVYFTGSDNTLDAAVQPGAGDTAKRTVAAPLGNRTKAGFELLAGAKVVRLSIKELGDDLYRISTPDNSGIRPSPQIRDNDVKLQVTRDDEGASGEIDVVLAAKVSWSLRFSGYAQEQNLDLSGGQVTGIEMAAGTGKAAVTLARASGTVPVRINGAVDELVLKSPSDSPVRVRVDGGAKSVVAGSRTLKDIAAGSTLTPKNWATANRYDVAAGARITSLTVENA